MNILVAEDTMINVRVLVKILEPQGYNIIVALNGEKACEIAEKILPDLILLDVMMPIMDGYETCQYLKSNDKTKHIPIIFLTARTEPDDIAKGFRLGAVDYIAKPFRREEILARMRAHLEIQSLIKALQEANKTKSQVNEKLSNALNRLKNTQAQLVHSDKMASLGVMVAGIAHEINNPTNFISAGAKNLSLEVDEFQSMLTEVMGEEAKASPIGKDIRGRFLRLSEQLGAIQNGVDRIKSIVRGLRIFSRNDSRDHHYSDLTQGIISTLALAQTQFKDRIVLTQSLAELPPIHCNVPQLNQVILNVVSNAVQAITENGTIQVRSALEADQQWLTIEVEDDGPGVSPELLTHIFDPFFTTKDVGVGTGLGLSISYGIIQDHGGQITATPAAANHTGALFRIRLPVHGVHSANA